MKKVSSAFSYIFSDNEWFNKVLVGGFYFLMIPFGIGIIMLNGFISQFVAGVQHGEKAMPYWRNFKLLFQKGIRQSLFSLLAIATMYMVIPLGQITVSTTSAILLLAIFLTINTVQITRSLGVFSLLISFTLLVIAISIGWMWIVVGWPLLIFLAILVQAFLFANKS